MATVAERQAALSRQPIWLLKVILDQCTLENGQAPCTAVDPCYYTFSTSQDLPNYTKGTFEWKFTNRGAPTIPGSYPYLMGPIKHTPTKLDQDKFKTSRGVMNLRLQEDNAHPLANPNKSTSQSDTGRFFRNWLARNPNYHFRLCELYRGYDGVAENDFELYWRGLIDNIEFTKDGIEIRAIDMIFRAEEAKYPNKISDGNTVQDNPLAIGAGVVTVNDVDEFDDATVNEPKQIKIEDEYIEYTSKAGATLVVSARGAYGSAAAEHALGKKIKQVLIYAGAGFTSGLPADHIFLDLFCNKAGIDGSLYIETTDVSLTISDAGGISGADTTIGVSAGEALPFEGIVLIELELISYTGVSGDNLTGCKREMYGTTAAAHADGVDVKPTTFTHEIGKWRQGADFQNRIESPKQVKTFITDLQKAVLCDVYQNEAGKIECKMQAPSPGESIEAIDEEDMKQGSRKVDRNEDSRITRVLVYYGQTEADPSTDISKYSGLRAFIGATQESSDSFNEVREHVITSPWITDQAEADWLAAHYFYRYIAGTPVVAFDLELYHDDKEVGDVIQITVPEIVDKDANEESRLYRIVKKVQKGLARLAFEAQDTGFGDKQYRLIGPTTLVTDYDASTAAERAKYCFISDGSDQLGAANDDTHRIY